MKARKIVHLTSVHPRYDTRIFIKECCSLVSNGYSVSLVVADGKGNQSLNGVDIIDVGKLSGRLNRIFKTSKKILAKAVEIDAEIYHFHDPELIPIGLKLKKLGKIVIFDSHEDVPKQILGKGYLNKLSKKVISFCYATYESWACKKLDIVIAATSSIKEKFMDLDINSVDVNNYPILGELFEGKQAEHDKSFICYVGGISDIRGISEIVNALEYVSKEIKLLLVGEFSDPKLRNLLSKTKGWNSVEELGFLNRNEVKNVLSKSTLGVVTFHPLPNHIDAQPNKLFEYMSAGIPVLASNFPLWEKIIEGNDCGYCADPLNAKSLAKTIERFFADRKHSHKMGMNGRQAVENKYNWLIEERKLLDVYKKLRDSE